MKTCFHKITAGIILVAIIAMIVFPSVVLLFPKKAEAQTSCISGIITGYISKLISGLTNFMSVPVADRPAENSTANTAGSTFGSWVSDCIIKPMVKALVKQLIHQFLSSIVDWINSGFDGSGPRFVSDPANFFADIVNRGVGEMVYGSDLKFLCSPFALDIKLALGLNYWGGGFPEQIKCTLSDVIRNTMSPADKLAYRNSWQSWLDLTTQPQNNPYGAYALAKSELEIRIANKQFVVGKETDWAGGFLSTKRCAKQTRNVSNDPLFGDSGGHSTQWDGDDLYDLTNGEVVGHCDRWETVTPGVTIKEGLSKSLGSQIDEYVNAEDIDAIFGALTKQLIGAVFSTTGLFSTSHSTNYYRSRFQSDVAAGAFNIGSGATAPAGFGGVTVGGVTTGRFDCSTIGNYVANADNKNVDYIDTTATPPIKNVKDVGGNISTPWPDKYIPTLPVPNPTQYKVYAQLTKYCAQQGFWTAAETAADSSIPPVNSSSQNVCSQQSRINSYNDILSTESSGYDPNLSSGGGGPDSAVDGSTMTYARLIGSPPWLEIVLKNQEMLSFIQIQTWRSRDVIGVGSRINFYETTSPTTTPLPISQTLTTAITTGSFILNLTPPARVKKIRIQQGVGSELRISEVTLHRHINPIINWTGESSAALNTPFDVFNGVTATKCTDNSALPNTSVSFTISPPPTGTPPSYTTSGNMITFQTAGTYTLTYTVNDGVASSQFTRIIVAD